MNTPQQRGGQAADVTWLLSAEALEIGRRAVEDELVELRDDRIAQLRNNGLVIKERDGSPSDVIRLGPEDALRIGLRAMLTSAPPAPPVGGWMPIESAPKDGRKFLAWRRHSTLPLIVFYNADYDQYECSEGHLVFSLTHWQPLPQPPKEKP